MAPVVPWHRGSVKNVSGPLCSLLNGIDSAIKKQAQMTMNGVRHYGDNELDVISQIGRNTPVLILYLFRPFPKESGYRIQKLAFRA
jgi:hypothetical protein